MNLYRRKKLYFVLGLGLLSVTIGSLVIYALDQNMNLFYSPTEVVQKQAPLNARIRVGGVVEKGSLVRQEGLHLEFTVTDFQEEIKVKYQGILPDLFREGQGVVALGRLTSHKVFVADQILAKHDENYMPPEVKQVLKKN